MLTLNKTKAALQSCQCYYQKLKQGQNTKGSAGGQRMSAAEAMGTAPMAGLKIGLSLTPDLADGCLPLAHTPFPQIWGELDPRSGCTAMQHTPSPMISGDTLTEIMAVVSWATAVGDTTEKSRSSDHYPDIGYQPFGSIPCLRSLSLQASLTHELKLPTPAALLICSRRSSSKRICFIVLPERSKPFFVFAGCIGSYHWCKVNLNGNYHFMVKQTKTAKPAGATNTNGPLTNNVIRSNAMAGSQHTQTHPKFTWLFLATPEGYPDCSPVVLRFDADTEATARAAFPGWALVFAAKIRAEAPCRVAFFDYTTRRGWEFDSSAGQEVGHV